MGPRGCTQGRVCSLIGWWDNIDRERRLSSSQGERYVVCCIGYLTRYSAAEVAHHSRLQCNSMVECLPIKKNAVGSIPIIYKRKAYFGDI